MRGKVNYSGHDMHAKIVDIAGEDHTLSHVPCWLVPAPAPHGIYGKKDDLISLPKDKIRILKDDS